MQISTRTDRVFEEICEEVGRKWSRILKHQRKMVLDTSNCAKGWARKIQFYSGYLTSQKIHDSPAVDNDPSRLGIKPGCWIEIIRSIRLLSLLFAAGLIKRILRLPVIHNTGMLVYTETGSVRHDKCRGT